MIFKRFKRIFIGCLGIFIILVILGAVFSAIIIKKFVGGVVTQKTGVVQTNTQNTSGQSYVDPKTGATISLGIDKVPDSFPKDFPIYPGATVQVSQTGNAAQSAGNGFWLTLETGDSVAQVKAFYETNLAQNGWTKEVSAGNDSEVNWAISKDSLSGYLAIANSNNQTSIVIILGEQK
jgi:hypothetical protein